MPHGAQLPQFIAEALQMNDCLSRSLVRVRV